MFESTSSFLAERDRQSLDRRPSSRLQQRKRSALRKHEASVSRNDQICDVFDFGFA